MSEPVTRKRPTVDLDDFEREMRDGQFHGYNDPLAELARLVGEQHDPYGDVFAREAAPAAPYEPVREMRGEPDAAGRQTAFSPRLSGDFAAIEAGLRSVPAAQDRHAPAHGTYAARHAEPTLGAACGDERFGTAQPGYADPAMHEANGAGAGAYGAGAYAPGAYDTNWTEPRASAASARSRRPVALLAATIAVGVIGVGGAFALKGHVATSPREVKTILADESPTKVQPPAEAVDKDADKDAAVLGKGQPSPTALADHQEQPVDLLQAARENAAAQARRTDAASVPVPPSPGQVQTSAAASPGQSFAMADMPAPKRVRVVSVRPDGTILADDKPAAASSSGPRPSVGKTSDRAGPVAKPSTPKVAAGKTTSRVTAPKAAEAKTGEAKTAEGKTLDQLADATDDGANPAPVPVKAKKPRPQRVASAETGEAEATREPAPEAASGGFAVQLAAPGSDADARAATSRLAKKYAGALSGHHLGVHKAESNGRSVYRVRVSSLTRPEAVSLCEKLKSEGGSCFVAKN